MSKLSTGVVLLLCGCGASASGAPSELEKAENTGGQSGSSKEARGDSGSGGSSSGSTGNGGATNTDAGGLVGMGGSKTGGAGTDSGAGGSTSGVKVVVSPHSSTVLAGHSLKLEVAVSGNANKAVTWSVAEPYCGTVSNAGDYAAPAAVPDPAVCHVKATSSADAHAFDVAVLGIATSGSTGTPGVWEDVTPAGISLATPIRGQENFGAQDVLVDPVLQSNIYAFFCYQGVWKSTNYGVTWAKVSTGTNASVLETGRPWTNAIDNDGSRDPKAPPTLYTTTGYGSTQGFFKSTDGGINWTHHDVLAAGVDPYSFDMDPYDNHHIITGLHEGPDLAESTDGGLTWKKIPANGKSIYPFFVDTGDAATTRKTWLAIPQDNGPALKTKNGGASFEPAGDFAHPHGGSQLFNSGSGTAYAGGTGGVWRSTARITSSWAAPGRPDCGVTLSPEVSSTHAANTAGVTMSKLSSGVCAAMRSSLAPYLVSLLLAYGCASPSGGEGGSADVTPGGSSAVGAGGTACKASENGGSGGTGGAAMADAGGTSFDPCLHDKPCAVMPFGDSITAGAGSSEGGGYRVQLFAKAVEAGKSLTFVGSQSSGPDTVRGLPFPKHNEGYPGYTIDGTMGILPLAATALRAAKPNIVLLMIGTNDVNGYVDLANAPARFGNLIDTVVGIDPNLLLVVAKIVPTTDDAEFRRTTTPFRRSSRLGSRLESTSSWSTRTKHSRPTPITKPRTCSTSFTPTTRATS